MILHKIYAKKSIWLVFYYGYLICCNVGYHVDACSLQDICQQVFEAAHKGDAATVPSLLLQHSLSPDLTNTVSNVIVNFVVLYHY